MIRAYRRNRGRAEDLGRALLAIAGGIWDRYRFTADREEFAQEVALHLLQGPLRNADVQKHIFNYLSTCAIRFGWKLRDKARGDGKRFLTYAVEKLQAGRPIPSTRRESRHPRRTRILRRRRDPETAPASPQAPRFPRLHFPIRLDTSRPSHSTGPHPRRDLAMRAPSRSSRSSASPWSSGRRRRYSSHPPRSSRAKRRLARTGSAGL